MEEKKKKGGRKGIVVVSLLLAVLLVVGGIFAYTYYLKRTTAELMSVVPSDAAFVFQVNDNALFAKSISSCKDNLNEVFSLDALAGFEYFADMASSQKQERTDIVIAGLNGEEGAELLFAAYMQKSSFDRIIKDLKINKEDYSTFETHKIYTAATHFHEFKIVYLNGIFVAAETMPLLQRSIHQLAGPQCLTSCKSFNDLASVIHKNDKQNWLIINHRQFVDMQAAKLDSVYLSQWNYVAELADWSAYLVRFSEKEMLLSGYSTVKDGSVFCQYAASEAACSVPENAIPSGISYYVCNSLPQSYTLAASEGDTAASSPVSLPMKEVVCFAVDGDTSRSHYLMVPADTLTDAVETAYFTSAPAGESSYKNVPVHLCRATNLAAFYPQMKQDFSTNYVFYYGGYYIFTESFAMVRSYLDDVMANKVLAGNQHYQFTKGNLPSNKGFEFYYVNNDARMNRFFARSFMRKKPGLSSLKIFAYSYAKPVGNLLPNTICVRF